MPPENYDRPDTVERHGRGQPRRERGMAPARKSVPAATADSRRPGEIDFARDIQPIFKQYCAECHGPTKARGRLRLHTPELILRGRPLRDRRHAGQERRQPADPPRPRPRRRGSDAARRRSAAGGDDRALRAWIDQGAPMPAPATRLAPARGESASGETADPEHWAYVKPSRPELPAVASTRPAWARNAIDRFVLARLEREQLTPSPEAPKATLLRRVTLDLTGLPPTPAELDAFLADTAPDAYERVVDRLLASPHYGERWARPWLDLARYADTNGYEKDNRRSIWKYRDWVIDALNRDMPFDQFTIEQIAGDMLPNATVDAEHRDRLPSQRDDQRGRRRRSRGIDVRSARRSREHDRDRLARHDARLRAVPQPQVRSVQPEGLLPAARVLRQHRLREPYVRRRHALLRGPARSRDAGAGDGAQARCRRRSTGSSRS